jgi:hypothetical protein
MKDVLLILHFFGLMLGAAGGIGSGIVMAYGRSLPEDKAGVVRGVGPILARTATVGVVLMLLTGPGMLFGTYSIDAMPVAFWIKMAFVATLTIVTISIEVIHGRVKAGNPKAAQLLPRLGPVAGISALLAVVFAALTFH